MAGTKGGEVGIQPATAASTSRCRNSYAVEGLRCADPTEAVHGLEAGDRLAHCRSSSGGAFAARVAPPQDLSSRWDLCCTAHTSVVVGGVQVREEAVDGGPALVGTAPVHDGGGLRGDAG